MVYNWRRQKQIGILFPLCVLLASLSLTQCYSELRSFVSIKPAQPENYTVLLDKVNVGYNYDLALYELTTHQQGRLQVFYLDTFLVYESVLQPVANDTVSVDVSYTVDNINSLLELSNVAFQLPDNTEVFFFVDFDKIRATDFFRFCLRNPLDSLVNANRSDISKEMIFEAIVDPVYDLKTLKAGISELRWDDVDRMFDDSSPSIIVSCDFMPHLLHSSLLDRTQRNDRQVHQYGGLNIYQPEAKTYISVLENEGFIIAEKLDQLYQVIDNARGASASQTYSSGRLSLLHALNPRGQAWIYLPVSDAAKLLMRNSLAKAEQRRGSDREMMRVVTSLLGDLEAASLELHFTASIEAKIRFLFSDPDLASSYAKAIYGLSFVAGKMVPPEAAEVSRALELVEVESEGRIAIVKLDLPESFARELIDKLITDMR